MPGYTMRKQDLDARLARIEGQVRGIRRMLQEDTYCIDVLTQLSSITGAGASAHPSHRSVAGARPASVAPPKVRPHDRCSITLDAPEP
jgi:Metal-sensitive transcriptional repressor